MSSYRSLSGLSVPVSSRFRNDVRSAVLGLTGLKTSQAVTAYTVSGAPFLTLASAVTIMDPMTLFDNIPMVPNSSQKYYVKSAECIASFSNSTNVRLVVRAFKLRCTKNCSIAIQDLLNEDAPNSSIPYINPTTSNAFRRYFHIEDVRFDTIPVEGFISYEVSDYFPGGKLINGDVEANLDEFEHVVGSRKWLLFFNTEPVESVAVGLLAGPVNPKVCVMSNIKYTYYVLEDNNPISNASTTITSVAAGNVISDATRVPFQNDNA